MFPNIDLGKLPPKSDDIDEMLEIEHEMIVNALTYFPNSFSFNIEPNSEKHTITIKGSYWDVGCKIGLTVCGWKNGFYKDCLFSPDESNFEKTFSYIEDGYYDALIIKDDVIKRKEAVYIGKPIKFKVTQCLLDAVDIELERAKETSCIVIYKDSTIIKTKRVLVGTTKLRIKLNKKHNTKHIYVFKYYQNCFTRIDKDVPYNALEIITL
ncbi:hypothetical protein EHI8A_182690 [Entamoeba histolytica HM-1:IMSS-B]|uniref:Uncharacterized protein n=6 Tax=Entamoeba histolytica TaxID=5759 RepID=B1N4G7_ENTH1|nr:hypothetical protein EHI_189180 [Entamoeba histolytica HM-1:IMSS]EMD45223.1 Hypothetical protein EHI5A_209130 [Entamoeba histolytica KU27]EMH76215.1 hypothetical protein EHI8A_182690 [Entamoeba histolytica HM-1:IMSS-B]EMS17797.1 hypothetical protein KM1_260000 [Entamoeba histolytica HM-3:IMSS]ENY61411.1 hypothetical protein EHI7A_161910 [Entamoeba histolytica HM-1:IMSS-A]GAT98361.1 hypothetical protein CL6EHI_189180 [Entamoeba histolytica]|eukprot:XP_001914083.1 hypothetical protein EHI_189180 [Entamoeba histolytica HM-1:IMSS]